MMESDSLPANHPALHTPLAATSWASCLFAVALNAGLRAAVVCDQMYFCDGYSKHHFDFVVNKMFISVLLKIHFVLIFKEGGETKTMKKPCLEAGFGIRIYIVTTRSPLLTSE
ncbi:hypothetical protein [Yersinia enterocolitica]|uniref:hypothetical protein n=1 Tax=Yersinia enterocolitica TaxID=630 RepID=UPI001C6083AE|nr:hypothetical protein [Yersinia enterocolitica]MBW5823180.1 hypothetical protein [Yersinia enterocolitica]MBW5853214.1 hypothetical protein [Yersinia enterocolitica]MBW5879279.1 hypothetical protein [Yersinia enterocolitica]